MKLSKYKLTPKGESYLKAAENTESPVKGIVITKKGRFDIRTLDDDGAEAIKGTGFVEEVKHTPAASKS